MNSLVNDPMASLGLVIDQGLCTPPAASHGAGKRRAAEVQAWWQQARTARASRGPAAALEVLTAAVAAVPDSGGLCYELGNVRQELGDRAEALEAFRRAVQLEPDFHPAYTNLAAALQQADRYEEAATWTHEAARRNPHCRVAQFNLGNLHAMLGNPQQAAVAYRRAIGLDPGYAKAHWNLAVAELLAGNYAAGWQEFEWRVPAGEVAWDHYPQPRWQGEPLGGKTILVHAEQGIGDEVLFATCYEDLIERGANCILVCEPRLAALFRRSFPLATVYGWQRQQDGAPCPVSEHVDFQIAAGSLPLHLRNSADAFPRSSHFLVPEGQHVTDWRLRWARRRAALRVGISWRAGGKLAESQRRSIALECWHDILTTPGVCFVNVQYGDVSEELAWVRREWGVEVDDSIDGDPLIDVDAYVAKLAALDLVISVGNATVHLAGAVGTPTWALLPFVPSWRWLSVGEECPWYGRVQLLRQSVRHRWDDVLERTAQQLRLRVPASAGARGARSASSGRGVVSPTANGRPARVETTPLPPIMPVPQSQSGALEPSGAPVGPVDLLDHAQLAQALARALEFHAAGRLDEAETLYRDVLRVSPRCSDAVHLLGVLAKQRGKTDAAVASIRRAIAIDGDRAPYHYNLGSILGEQGEHEEAVACHRRSLEIDPHQVDAWVNMGLSYQHLRREDEALDCFARALALDPECVEAHLNRGICLSRQHRIDEAVAAFQETIRLQPSFAKGHNALGAVYLEDERHADAVESFRQALALEPNYVTALANLGLALRQLERYDEAEDCFEQLLAIAPTHFSGLTCLAGVYVSVGRFAEAVELYRRAHAARPDCLDTMNSLANALRDVGRHEEALGILERARQLQPDHPVTSATRGLTLLQLGRFEEGWREYESRWRCRQSGAHRDQYVEPRWEGQPLAGKTILVHGEQGVGDEVMFASCYSDLVAAAGQLVVVCDERLATLLARSFPTAEVFGVRRGMDHLWRPPQRLRVDYQIPAGSVPRFVRRRLEDFPRRRQYLAADPRRVAEWRARFDGAGPGPKIGIAWRGGTQRDDRLLRWTPLELWRPLLQTPGVVFVNLQYDQFHDDLARVRSDWGVTVHHWDELDPKQDLDGLAAQISALDLVISVGNAGVHMAGALGTPAWALTPRFRGWRWMTDTEQTPWYRSVRLFRQSSVGDWVEPFERIGREFLAWLAERADK